MDPGLRARVGNGEFKDSPRSTQLKDLREKRLSYFKAQGYKPQHKQSAEKDVDLNQNVKGSQKVSAQRQQNEPSTSKSVAQGQKNKAWSNRSSTDNSHRQPVRTKRPSSAGRRPSSSSGQAPPVLSDRCGSARSTKTFSTEDDLTIVSEIDLVSDVLSDVSLSNQNWSRNGRPAKEKTNVNFHHKPQQKSTPKDIDALFSTNSRQLPIRSSFKSVRDSQESKLDFQFQNEDDLSDLGLSTHRPDSDRSAEPTATRQGPLSKTFDDKTEDNNISGIMKPPIDYDLERPSSPSKVRFSLEEDVFSNMRGRAPERPGKETDPSYQSIDGYGPVKNNPKSAFSADEIYQKADLLHCDDVDSFFAHRGQKLNPTFDLISSIDETLERVVKNKAQNRALNPIVQDLLEKYGISPQKNPTDSREMVDEEEEGPEYMSLFKNERNRNISRQRKHTRSSTSPDVLVVSPAAQEEGQGGGGGGRAVSPVSNTISTELEQYFAPNKPPKAPGTEVREKQRPLAASADPHSRMHHTRTNSNSSSGHPLERLVHIDAIREHHRKKSSDGSKVLGPELSGCLSPAFSCSSLDRYFGSLKDANPDNVSILSTDAFEPVPEPEIMESPRLGGAPTHNVTVSLDSAYDSKEDSPTMQQEEEVWQHAKSEVSSAVSGLPSRLKDMGIDLGFLKQSKQGDGNHNQLEIAGKDGLSEQFPSIQGKADKEKMVLVCPECDNANKPYISWCLHCGEVLIGVVPIPLKDKPKKSQEEDDFTLDSFATRKEKLRPKSEVCADNLNRRNFQPEDILDELFNSGVKNSERNVNSNKRYQHVNQEENEDEDNDENSALHLMDNNDKLRQSIGHRVSEMFMPPLESDRDTQVSDMHALDNQNKEEEPDHNEEEEDNEDEENFSPRQRFFQLMNQENGGSEKTEDQKVMQIPEIHLDKDSDSDSDDDFFVEAPGATGRDSHDKLSTELKMELSLNLEESHGSQILREKKRERNHFRNYSIESHQSEIEVMERPDSSADKALRTSLRTSMDIPALNLALSGGSENLAQFREVRRAQQAAPSIEEPVSRDDQEQQSRCQAWVNAIDTGAREKEAKEEARQEEEEAARGVRVDDDLDTNSSDTTRRLDEALDIDDEDDMTPFLEKLLQDQRKRPTSAKPTKSCGQPKVASKLRQSLDAPAPKRHWEKSSLAWSSFNARELKVKSSVVPQLQSSAGRPASANNRNRPRSAFTLRNEERNASPVNNGRSSENVRSRGGKVEGASRRPASASVKTRSSLTGSGDRPRSVAPPGGGSRSGFSLRNRPSSAKQHQGQGDADPHSPRSTNMKRGTRQRGRHCPSPGTYQTLSVMSPRISLGELSLLLCLPDELLLYILSYLSHKDLARCMRTCTHIHRVASDHSLWRHITISKTDTLWNDWLEKIGEHKPVSLSILKCRGEKVTRDGLRGLFRACADSLQELNMSGSSKGGLQGDTVLLHAATRCHSLTHLDMSWCSVTDHGVAAIADGTDSLESVCLNGCQLITEEAVDSLLYKHSKSLRVLELFGCVNIKPSAIEKIYTHCKGLTTLNIGQCYKVTDNCIIDLSRHLPRLRSLELRGCKQIKDTCVHHVVSNCKRLETFTLANCSHISDVSLLAIATYAAQNIRNLDVGGCKNITDTGLRALTQSSPQLQHLDISSSGVTHRSVSMLSSYCSQNLLTLKVNFCKDLTEQSLIRLAKNCKNLHSLHMYGIKGIRNLSKIQAQKPDLTIHRDINQH